MNKLIGFLSLSALLALGCSESRTTQDVMPAPDGGTGVCCPTSEDLSCERSGRELRGGWAMLESECNPAPPPGAAPSPLERYVDDNGCPALRDRSDVPCCGCAEVCSPGDACDSACTPPSTVECVDNVYLECLDSTQPDWCPSSLPTSGTPCCVSGPAELCGDPVSIQYECLDNRWVGIAVAG